MATYKTPGVYVEEIATLPPSVAEVATAIPAFIGFTAKGKAGTVEVEEIKTLLEFEERFGRPKATPFTANADDTIAVLTSYIPDTPLWYALSLYFKNGGGRCYVVSVDNHDNDATAARFTAGLDALEAVDEPTLIVMPEAVELKQTDYDSVCQAALAHCKDMTAKGDGRFAILDVRAGDVAKFRTGVGTDGLAFGAAYHPYLKTSLLHAYDEKTVKVGDAPAAGGDAPTLDSLKTSNTSRYNAIKKALADQRVELPPSAAIAGVICRVDRERGVWKAPANVSLASVIAPKTQITHDDQETLNLDPTAGKSINAIRAFAGKGVMVWGARTLAGNDNEWRYINVRRLFITIEESAKKATGFAVFEPNDSSTWLKVKGMLESYLYGLWEQGALQGSTAEQAFYVNVGLGKTMTPQDILEGRLIVEIGIAAVRPAEFIVLRFSHKLPEA
jgi:uncharacterized protein